MGSRGKPTTLGVMASLIRREDIDLVRERARIDEVVGEHVTLRRAGMGSMKGLCPFHDERTPSFHVRPQLGLWHCFGCGEGGDVFTFLQELNHMTFVESVEYLADKYGVELRYEGGKGPKRGPAQGQRRRLLEAHRLATEFYAGHLLSRDGEQARAFLKERGFTEADVKKFAVGASPGEWDALTRFLTSKGFTHEELTTAGLAIAGPRGLYDRFRGRVMWPIRDLTGATIGFGARRLGEDENSPKYLNTPETPIYQKSQVLYGLDIAKRDVGRDKRIVIVEGYTDVMAAHAAGITTAVATCGTAFGPGHTALVRRLMGDTKDPASGVVLSDGHAHGGEVVFTFDGDEAGRNAARRAYMEDQSFAAQTFVAVDEEGLDPLDVRLARGNEGLRALVDSKIPMFEFVLRSVLGSLDLNRVEGRVEGMRAAAPILAGIKDQSLRTEYSRLVAGWLGMDPRQVNAARMEAERALRRAEFGRGTSADPFAGMNVRDRGSERGAHHDSGLGGGGVESHGGTPLSALTQEDFALAAALQRPLDALGAGFESLEADVFENPLNRVVFEYVISAKLLDNFIEKLGDAEEEHGVGDRAQQVATERWTREILDSGSKEVDTRMRTLLLVRLPVNSDHDAHGYAQGMIRALARRGLGQRVENLRATLNRLDPNSPDYRETLDSLMKVELRRRSLMDSDQ